MTPLRELTPEEIRRLVEEAGGTPNQARRLARAVLRDGVADLADSGVARRLLERIHAEPGPAPVVRERRESADGTLKLLYALPGGDTVEGVLIPERARLTLCVSTQVGCASGCRFCLSGAGGLVRGLRLSEMLGQVHAAAREAGRRPTNIVLMGSGEPLDNYEEVRRLVGVLTSADGCGLSPRKVTLSTSGLVPGILRMARELEISLAVSLNAADDETRSRLMPINRRWGLAELTAALRAYCRTGRRVVIEYILIRGVNDGEADAARLARLLEGLPCMINLLRFNPFPGTPFRRPSEERVRRFQKVLLDAGHVSVVRDSRGLDIGAACGQLKAAEGEG